MATRRNFFKTACTAALGSALVPKSAQAFFKNAPMPPVGLQLFTFFNVIDADVAGTLKKIRAVGYTEIESAFSKLGGYYGMKPNEFQKLLADLGLSWKAHHVLGAPFKMPADAKPILHAQPEGKHAATGG